MKEGIQNYKPMEVFQVPLPIQMLISRLFSGFVFRQNKDGKHFIKVSEGQRRDIKKYLGLSLTNPLNR